MADLFNIDIEKIKLDGTEVLLMKLNGDVVYEKETFRIEYTVYEVDEYLCATALIDLDRNYRFGLPRIYTSPTDYSYNYSNIRITKKDGTITSDPWTKCNEIEKVTLWYPENTYKISFIFPFNEPLNDCPAVKDINYCNTSNFISMTDLFHENAIQNINKADKWKTKNVTSMVDTFYYSNRLEELNLSNWNVSNVTDMRNMFCDCYSLTSLDLSNWDTSKVEDMYHMFNNCTALHTLRLDNCNKDTISKIINSYGFPTGPSLTGATKTIYCKEENVVGLTAPTNWVFNHNLDEETPDEPETPEIPDTRPLYQVNEFKENAEITTAEVMVNSTHTDLSEMFYKCTNLASVNTKGWDTSNVTDMKWMFDYCIKLQSIEVSNFNTSSVENMRYMFAFCDLLISLDMSNWDTSNVTDMRCMFRDCDELILLDMSNFDMSKVSNTDQMFYYCSKLHTIRLDNCSHDTISKIITSYGFPTNTIDGVTRTIYCKRANAEGLTAPTNWVFSYID